ncbi:hypothetical protein U1Q18_002531 [Sarracenia purpurea var. burkii]
MSPPRNQMIHSFRRVFLRLGMKPCSCCLVSAHALPSSYGAHLCCRHNLGVPSPLLCRPSLAPPIGSQPPASRAVAKPPSKPSPDHWLQCLNPSCRHRSTTSPPSPVH